MAKWSVKECLNSKIEGSLVCAEVDAMCCVLEQDT